MACIRSCIVVFQSVYRGGCKLGYPTYLQYSLINVEKAQTLTTQQYSLARKDVCHNCRVILHVCYTNVKVAIPDIYFRAQCCDQRQIDG